MGKKKFIDKNNSTKFYVMHRSLRDEAHAREGVPSEFVLVPAEQADRRPRRYDEQPYQEGGGGRPSRLLEKVKDHVNELGFANDGYDYSQHLREMGGGRFITKEGASGSYELPKEAILPEDVLPSVGDLQRDLEAITISHELMDEDLRAALFDGEDEEGAFEELEDDFIQMVMTEPEAPDFDFDAHIANLIAKSEDKLGIRHKARGWEGSDAMGLKPHRRGEAVYGIEEDEEEEEDDEDEDGYFDEQELVFLDDNDNVIPRPPAASAAAMTSEARAALDAQLEKALEEYDDSDLGALSEADDDDEDLAGNMGLEEEDFQAALDEFLQEEKDRVYAEGNLVRKGARHLRVVRAGDQPGEVDNNNYDVQPPVQAEEIHAMATEQAILQEVWAEEVAEVEAESAERREEEEQAILNCQAYLKEVKIREEWDCETILSTYSTMDNHPRLLAGSVSRRSKSGASSAAASTVGKLNKRLNKTQLQGYREYMAENFPLAAGEAGSSSSVNSYGVTPAVSDKEKAALKQQGQKIVLAGRLNLPEGFGPDRSGGKKKTESTQQQPAKINTIVEEEEEEQEEEEEDDDDDEEDEEGEEEGEEDGEKRSKKGAKPKESAEEKKARKIAVKQAKRERREQKKQLKMAFKEEAGKILRRLGKEASTERHTVYTYS
eukprot:gene7236-8002_t